MGTGYVRRSTTEIATGEVIEAADFNNEFNDIVSAFTASTGHSHDGTTAEGGNVTKLLGAAITIGDGSAGADIVVTFDGETSDGVLTWMEDEDHFKFSDDIVVDGTKRLYFNDEGGEYIHGDGTDLNLVSGADINIPANIGLTFGDDGEKIEGDGSDLTVSSSAVLTLDAGGGITIDADSGTITFADGGVSLGTITSSGYSGTAAVATVATTVTITDNESTNENNALIFTAGGDVDGGNIGLESDGTLTYNPSTGKITATGFIGALTGDVTGDVTGTADVATVATTVTITDNESTNEDNALIFTAGGDVDGGNIGLESDGTLTYNPSTGKITATGFIGALTGNVTGDVTGTADVATVATTVTITDNESTDESNALVFTAGGDVDGGNLGLESDGTLTYNPSTGAVTATGFVGTTIELGHATDTTLARSGSGDVTIEGNAIYRAGGTDVPVADGGTGASSLTDGGVLLGSGTGAITAMAVLADGEMIVGDGSGDPVAKSGATLLSSIGLGTGDSPTFTTVTASTSLIPDAAGGADLGSTSAEWGDVYVADNKFIKLGSDQDFTIEYDEDGQDTTRVVAAGGVTLSPHGTSTGNTTALKFGELAAGGTNYVGFKAPDAIAGDVTWTLPNADGSDGHVLKTNGSGALSFAAAAGGVSLANDTNNYVATATGSGLNGEANLIFDGNNLTMKGPTLTVGDATAEDTMIVFDGNAQDYRIGLDDGTDTLEIGLGNAHGTTAHIITDVNGIVRKPLQPAFSAHRSSAGATVTHGSTTKIAFNAESFDVNADNATDTFTAPVDGSHLFTAVVDVYGIGTNNSGRLSLYLYKNDALFAELCRVASISGAGLPFTEMSLAGSVFVDLDASDEICLYLYNNTGATVTVNYGSNLYSYWGGTLLG